MTREEQIKEITMLTCPAYCWNKDKKCAGIQDCDMKCLHYQRCEIVYDNANYHKQIEAEWVPVEKLVPDWGANIIHHYECSNCQTLEYTNDRKYCSNCGAKMIGRR